MSRAKKRLVGVTEEKEEREMLKERWTLLGFWNGTAECEVKSG